MTASLIDDETVAALVDRNRTALDQLSAAFAASSLLAHELLATIPTTETDDDRT